MFIKQIEIVYRGDNFGEFIKEIRHNLGMTQVQFSEILQGRCEGFSHSSIRSYEQGKSDPKFDIKMIDNLRENLKDELNDNGISLVVKKGGEFIEQFRV